MSTQGLQTEGVLYLFMSTLGVLQNDRRAGKLECRSCPCQRQDLRWWPPQWSRGRRELTQVAVAALPKATGAPY